MKDDHISLKTYVDQKFELSEKAVQAALAAQKEAIIKAENATERRFESVNEFRNTLADQQRNLMPRSESEIVVKGLNDRIQILEDSVLKSSSATGGARNLWVIIVGVIGLVATVVGLVAYLK